MPANQAAITRSAVCPTEKKMEPQIAQNTQRLIRGMSLPSDLGDGAREGGDDTAYLEFGPAEALAAGSVSPAPSDFVGKGVFAYYCYEATINVWTTLKLHRMMHLAACSNHRASPFIRLNPTDPPYKLALASALTPGGGRMRYAARVGEPRIVLDGRQPTGRFRFGAARWPGRCANGPAGGA